MNGCHGRLDTILTALRTCTRTLRSQASHPTAIDPGRKASSGCLRHQHGRQPGCVQTHERGECVGGGRRSKRMLHEQSGKPRGFVTERRSDRGLQTLSSPVIGLVEEQAGRSVDSWKSSGKNRPVLQWRTAPLIAGKFGVRVGDRSEEVAVYRIPMSERVSRLRSHRHRLPIMERGSRHAPWSA